MNAPMHTLLIVLGLSIAVFSANACATTERPIRRTLQRTIQIPAGDSVTVQNLAGRITVTQSTGPLQVDATVVAAGPQARALARSVKLDISTMGRDVRVHVDYPVTRYDTFLYRPAHADTHVNGGYVYSGAHTKVHMSGTCLLGKFLCFHGRTKSDVRYQGKRVQVNESEAGASGAPLQVNVAVRLPAHVAASFREAVGPIRADGLTNDLSLVAQSGDIRVQDLHGRLDSKNIAGNAYLAQVASPLAKITTEGGNVTGDRLSGVFDIHADGNAGHVTLDTVAGTLSVTTNAADVRVAGDLSGLHSLRTNVTVGNTYVTGNVPSLTALDAENTVGDLVLHVNDLSMHLDASATLGHVNIDLPGAKSTRVRSDNYSGNVGAGTGTGTLSSINGNITVAPLSPGA